MKGELTMPFNQTTGFSFTESGSLRMRRKHPACMGSYNSGRWIYVGEAQDIETRLLLSLRRESDQSACIFGNSPTHFVFEQVAGELARKVRERD